MQGVSHLFILRTVYLVRGQKTHSCPSIDLNCSLNKDAERFSSRCFSFRCDNKKIAPQCSSLSVFGKRMRPVTYSVRRICRLSEAYTARLLKRFESWRG